jgi:predicted DNA-binding transcriptional regulator
MDRDLIKLLEAAGFTEKEASVYLALLELGKGTVTDVSRLTGLKRSIIYVIVEGLIKRGYANEVPDVKINMYRATDPSVILVQLKGVAKNFSEMLPMFRTLGNRGKTRPKITYHETKEGILKMWDGMSGNGDAFYIYSSVRSEQYFPNITKRWLREYDWKAHPIGNRHLIPNDSEEFASASDFLAAGERVRCLDELKSINMDFTLFGKGIAITSFEENPFIVVIESEELVRSIRPLFEIAWAKGKEIGK